MKIKVIRMLGCCWGNPIIDSYVYTGNLIDERGFYNFDGEVQLFDYLIREDNFQSYLEILDYDTEGFIATYNKDSGYVECSGKNTSAYKYIKEKEAELK